jgi:hypothetical protein
VSCKLQKKRKERKGKERNRKERKGCVRGRTITAAHLQQKMRRGGEEVEDKGDAKSRRDASWTDTRRKRKKKKRKKKEKGVDGWQGGSECSNQATPRRDARGKGWFTSFFFSLSLHFTFFFFFASLPTAKCVNKKTFL